MRTARLASEHDFDGWRRASRALAAEDVPPGEVSWEIGRGPAELSAAAGSQPSAEGPAFPVPRAFPTLAETVIRHADPERFSLLYAMLLHLRADRAALDDAGHPLVRRLERMAREVRSAEIGRKAGVPALPERNMTLPPKSKLSAAEEAGLAAADAAERRIQPGGNLLRAWEEVLADAKRCTRCHLYKHATQTVFGEGPLDARIMFVGEQPGDQEDLAARPFVGPAGQLFDRALADAGVERSATYVTNAVKHFKFEPRGKRRIHSKPQGPEIEACRWWIEQERALIRPAVTVALGATAARSLFGRVVTITSLRGAPQQLPDHGGEAWVTVHPSFLLRVRYNREEEYARFVADLRRIGERVKALA
ncbi:MAG: UdgX family uracil-DNA binding protein [Pseudomonadota bacterium]|nr:UdgX family uracil-DNA binding protein [Pseudomonadota bacterium]